MSIITWILDVRVSLGLSPGVPSNIAFNLALPTVFSFSAINLYANRDPDAEKIPVVATPYSLHTESIIFLSDCTGKSPEYCFLG